MLYTRESNIDNPGSWECLHCCTSIDVVVHWYEVIDLPGTAAVLIVVRYEYHTIPGTAVLVLMVGT